MNRTLNIQALTNWRDKTEQKNVNKRKKKLFKYMGGIHGKAGRENPELAESTGRQVKEVDLDASRRLTRKERVETLLRKCDTQ